MGLRNFSSPFDWVISDFQGIISAIRSHFSDFLSPELLCQNTENRNHYCNPNYGIYFFHDFTKYRPLSEQLPSVKEKYDRRIRRFYEKIKEPTLFFRYICTEEGSTEFTWIENNYEEIRSLLRSFHPENDIVFISHEAITSDVFQIFHVPKDDIVSRSPIRNSPELYPIVQRYTIPGQKENIRRYNQKIKIRNNPFNRAKRVLCRTWHRYFGKTYLHTKTYTAPGK